MQQVREWDTSETAVLNRITDQPPSDEAVDRFKASVLAKLSVAIGKDPPSATGRDWFVATALGLRHSLRSRPVSPNHQGWLPGGIPGGVAVVLEPMGIRTARSCL